MGGRERYSGNVSKNLSASAIEARISARNSSCFLLVETQNKIVTVRKSRVRVSGEE